MHSYVVKIDITRHNEMPFIQIGDKFSFNIGSAKSFEVYSLLEFVNRYQFETRFRYILFILLIYCITSHLW